MYVLRYYRYFSLSSCIVVIINLVLKQRPTVRLLAKAFGFSLSFLPSLAQQEQAAASSTSSSSLACLASIAAR